MANKRNIIYVAVLWFGAVLGAVLSFAQQILLAKNMTAEALGDYSALFFLVMTFAPLCALGVPQYWLKEFGEKGWGGVSHVKPALLFSMLSTLLVLIVLLVWIFFAEGVLAIQAGAAMVFVAVGFCAVELVSSILQLEEKYLMLSIWQVVQAALRLVVVYLAVYVVGVSLNVKLISWMYFGVAMAVVSVASIKILNFSRGHVDLKGHGIKNEFQLTAGEIVGIKEVARDAAPYGLAGFFYLIYSQLSIVFVKAIAGASAAGNYSVAFMFVSAAMLVPGVIYQKFLLPKLHRWSNGRQGMLSKMFALGNYAMLGFGVLVALGIYLLSPWLIGNVFGERYDDAVLMSRVLAVSVPVIYVASNVGSLLLTKNHMKKKVWYMFFVAIVSSILNMLLIPGLGANGASISLLVSNLLLLTLYFRAVKKYVLVG